MPHLTRTSAKEETTPIKPVANFGHGHVESPHQARAPPPPESPCRLFLAERAPLREPRLAARRLAQHLRATGAHDDGLGVREDGRDGEAAGALDVHEE